MENEKTCDNNHWFCLNMTINLTFWVLSWCKVTHPLVSLMLSVFQNCSIKNKKDQPNTPVTPHLKMQSRKLILVCKEKNLILMFQSKMLSMTMFSNFCVLKSCCSKESLQTANPWDVVWRRNFFWVSCDHFHILQQEASCCLWHRRWHWLETMWICLVPNQWMKNEMHLLLRFVTKECCIMQQNHQKSCHMIFSFLLQLFVQKSHCIGRNIMWAKPSNQFSWQNLWQNHLMILQKEFFKITQWNSMKQSCVEIVTRLCVGFVTCQITQFHWIKPLDKFLEFRKCVKKKFCENKQPEKEKRKWERSPW
mgnify:CR=1 FL=1